MRLRLLTALVGALVLAAGPAAAPAGAQLGADLDRVVRDYFATGGELDPCVYTTATLKAARSEIPPTDQLPDKLRAVEPQLRKAIADALRAHKRGDCDATTKKRRKGASPAPALPKVPPAPTAPALPTPPSGSDKTGIDVQALGRALGGGGAKPAAPAPAPAAPATPAAPAAAPAAPAVRAVHVGQRDGNSLALALALGAFGGLALLAALTWALGRRLAATGQAPVARHAASEAGFRVGAVWADFVDWVRLGR